MTPYLPRPFGEVDTILLATDGTEYSEGAIQESIFFAQACKAKLVILHIIKTDSEMAISAHAKLSEQKNKVMPHLERIESMAQNEGIESQIVVTGSFQPDKTIVEEAVKHKADVIIMGLCGKSGLRKFFIGSMTNKVIGHGFPKVLVVPHDFLNTGEDIILASDGSQYSELASHEAVSMSKKCSTLTKITILSVAEREHDLPAAQANIEAIRSIFQKESVETKYTANAVVGRPADVVVETARANNSDMIIVGGYGLSGVSKMIMGSTTERIIAMTPCAVLVIGDTSIFQIES
ncbi:MAG: universal stress protein [Desulfobulbaceae bacterium]|uniref:Universal stress protein n=1 Tax=Candidatus Desulfobia pelagia TaxID=2841692 RepID=A0A8J6NF00_9BACT|nr:universal stress protein [Candidatus Desulfobia pelagia]